MRWCNCTPSMEIKIKQANFFTITFMRLSSADLDRIFALRMTPPSTPRVGVEKGVEKLSPIERALHLLITANPSISKHSMCIEGGLTKKMVEYNLEKLREKGIIKRVGPDRGGRWEIVDNQ